MISRTQGRTTDTQTRHVLLDGTTAPADAREPVLTLLDAAINLEKLRNLRAQVNLQASDPEALSAIARLREARARALELLARAESEGLRIRLDASLSIEAVEPRR